jgi:hypothetical protein
VSQTPGELLERRHLDGRKFSRRLLDHETPPNSDGTAIALSALNRCENAGWWESRTIVTGLGSVLTTVFRGSGTDWTFPVGDERSRDATADPCEITSKA